MRNGGLDQGVRYLYWCASMRWLPQTDRSELAQVVAAMLTSTLLVITYVALTRSHGLDGDELEYDLQARFFADGKLWWSTTPFGIPHESLWKAPLYPAWVGFWYWLVGSSPTAVVLIQAPLAGVSVGLSWLLARRLLDPRAALLAAWIVALFPLAWEFNGLLMTEALAVPLTVGTMLVFLGREPTTRVVVTTGALVGVGLLLRPTAFFLLAGAFITWALLVGWRRGLVSTAVATLVAILVIAPWTVRNYLVTDDFVPISVQDSALYGVFNEVSANDPISPWAWRAYTPDAVNFIETSPPVDDGDVRAELRDQGLDYIRDHPESVVKAFYYNGITRMWDLRSPADALVEADTEGRSRVVRGIGYFLHWLLLPAALLGLWRLRRRPELALAIVAMLATLTMLHTAGAYARYRAPVVPLLAICAASLLPARPNSGHDPLHTQPPSGRAAGPTVIQARAGLRSERGGR